MDSKPPLPGTARSWKVVVGLLVGLPLLFTLVLLRWLGTPREGFEPSYIFARLSVTPVETVSTHSLAYGNLLFIRLELDEGARKALLPSLSSFQVSRGKAEKPIALKLERAWWNPPEGEQGTLWRNGGVSIWNPDSRPDIFYAVVLQGD